MQEKAESFDAVDHERNRHQQNGGNHQKTAYYMASTKTPATVKSTPLAEISSGVEDA